MPSYLALTNFLSVFLSLSLSACGDCDCSCDMAKPFGLNMHIMSTWPQRFIYNCVET